MLLAVHELRGGLECLACAAGPPQSAALAVTAGHAVRELLELIAALDRRAPQVQRAGEAAIARDAAALKAQALRRIEELEGAPGSADPGNTQLVELF